MKIYYENSIEEIKNLVLSKAKYQKVMLLYDNDVSNLDIGEIYDAIKEVCVYNSSSISSDKDEVYNGYKLIIFRCSVDSFLKCSIDREEFINVFYPTDNFILPYFLSHNNYTKKTNNILLLHSNQLDINMVSSVNFNIFFNYLKNLFYGIRDDFIYQLDANREITQFNVMSCLEKMEEDCFFVDIDILKKCDIDYGDLAIVDLILIDAFILLIQSIKNQNIMLVDVYKSAKENTELIDKFYSLFQNEVLSNLIILNYNCLYGYCLKTKQKILELIGFFNVDKKHVDNLINKVKNYAKDDKGLISYLYLYNIFNV